MKYDVKILTPVNIGSGEELTGFEYVLDQNTFCKIDMNKLFMTPGFDTDNFVEKSGNRNFSMEAFNKQAALNNVLYKASISNSVKKSLQKSLSSGYGTIREHIKTRGYPYIPGSSLKGAIRTALADYILGSDQAIQFLVKKKFYNLGGNRKYADKDIMKILFGEDPNHDLLRGLQVSDTYKVEDNALGVYIVNVLSTTSPYHHGWKQFPKRNVSIDRASDLFTECLKPGAILSGELVLDKWLYSEKVSEVLGFKEKVDHVEKLPRAIRERSREYITKELEFYRQYNQPKTLDDLIQWYNDLLDELNSWPGNSFPLQLGWGAGWRAMTVSVYMENQRLTRSVKKSYRLGNRRIPEYPKTRRLCVEDNNPVYPMGWVQVTLDH